MPAMDVIILSFETYGWIAKAIYDGEESGSAVQTRSGQVLGDARGLMSHISNMAESGEEVVEGQRSKTTLLAMRRSTRG